MRPRKVTPGWPRTTPNGASRPGCGSVPAWTGSTVLDVGDPVTAEQMRALFGCGLHPLAELRLQQLEGPDLTEPDFQDVTRLGAPFKIVDDDVSPFRVEVAKRIAAINTAIGVPVDASVRRLTGRGCGPRWPGSSFLAEHGRDPIDAAGAGRADRERLTATNADGRRL